MPTHLLWFYQWCVLGVILYKLRELSGQLCLSPLKYYTNILFLNTYDLFLALFYSLWPFRIYLCRTLLILCVTILLVRTHVQLHTTLFLFQNLLAS
jgi:hypothetical protein